MVQHPSARTAPPRHSAGATRHDARPVEALLEQNGALLARLKLCYGADRPTFERDLLPLLHGYARYVHLLPATADTFFSEPGGLLRLGLETAFFALQGTDAHIFSGKATITERVELEPRWRLATLVGGLCSELHRALGPMTVVADDGAVWPACRGPLADWLAQHACGGYRVLWRDASRDASELRGTQEARGAALFALPHVLPPELLQHLDHAHSPIVPHLLASIGGVPLAEHNVLDRLVRRSAALVIGRDLLVHAGQRGSAADAEHLARYLLEALRRLAATHSAWVPNQDKSRVWYALDGLFLLWPGCGHDVLALLATDELAGMPGDAPAVLDILLQAGAIVPRTPDQVIWSIQTPIGKGPMSAVKLSTPALLLAGVPVLAQPLDQRLAVTVETRGPLAQVAADVPLPTAALRPQSAATPGTTSPRSTAPLDAVTGQLSLLGDAPGPVMARAEQHGVSDAAQAETPSTRFKAPLRLHPAVTAALGEMVAAHTAQAAVEGFLPDDEGVFIALEQFQRRGVQPALALRALREARLLVSRPGDQATTCTLSVNGTPTLGVRLAGEHFEGLRRAPPAAGGVHSGQVDREASTGQAC